MMDPGPHPESPRGPREPIFNAPPAIAVLIAMMATIHAFRGFLPRDADLAAIYWGAIVPARYGLGPDYLSEGLPGGGLWLAPPFITYTFLHGDWLHLIFNSVWLLAFGAPVARRLGVGLFLVFYFLCGAAGAALHLATASDLLPVIGASAAVSGCMAGAVRFAFHPRARGGLASIFEPRVAMFIAIWFVLNLVFGLTGLDVSGETQLIAWEAHIGGFLAGLALIAPFDRLARQRLS